jgi:hypothetical protein
LAWSCVVVTAEAHLHDIRTEDEMDRNVGESQSHCFGFLSSYQAMWLLGGLWQASAQASSESLASQQAGTQEVVERLRADLGAAEAELKEAKRLVKAPPAGEHAAQLTARASTTGTRARPLRAKPYCMIRTEALAEIPLRFYSLHLRF